MLMGIAVCDAAKSAATDVHRIFKAQTEVKQNT